MRARAASPALAPRDWAVMSAVLFHDYGSPASAVAVARVDRLVAAGIPLAVEGLDVVGVALRLPPGVEVLAELGGLTDEAAAEGVVLRRPRTLPPTAAAHAVEDLAREVGLGAAWRAAAYRALWADAADLADTDVLVRLRRRGRARSGAGRGGRLRPRPPHRGAPAVTRTPAGGGRRRPGPARPPHAGARPPLGGRPPRPASADLAVAAFPVGGAELELLELAGGGAGEVVAELDAAWGTCSGRGGRGSGRSARRSVAVCAGCQHDERDHGLAPLLVGDADDRDLGHGGV